MQRIVRVQIFVSAFFGFTAVLCGALGAHALEETLAGHQTTSAWETAALYHLAHALALFGLGIWRQVSGDSASNTWAFVCWTAGIFLFSGSLYALALGGPGILGPITPLGGLLLLAGWVAIFVGAWKAR